MRKHILVIISSFRWGGINRSLQSWLKMIDPTEYDVDVFVTVHSGNYEHSFNHCTILPEDRNLGSLLDQKEYRKGLKLFRFVVLKALNKLTEGNFQRWLYSKVGNRIASRKRYNAVIGWGEGVPTVFVSRIEHPNRVAWIHCDYTQYTSGPTERAIYASFKSIVCVSKYTRESFLSYYPEMEGKVHTIYNILDVDGIRRLAKEPMDVEYDKSIFNIVSVGRVAPVKRFSEIPTIAKKLVDAGCDFMWYIIGPYCVDNEYNKIIKDIKEFDLEDKVALMGGRINPYPYIANASLHVCTSQSESWSYTVNEANVLGVPSVSTDFGAIYESIIGDASLVAAPIESLHKKIATLMTDENKYTEIVNLLCSFSCDNKASMNHILSLLG